MLLLHTDMNKLLLLCYCITLSNAHDIAGGPVRFEIHAVNNCQEDSPLTKLKLSKKNGCEMLKSLSGFVFIEVCKAIGRPNANCPIPKGKYFVENKLINYSQISLTRLLDGRFKATVFGTNQDRIMLFCVQAEFSAIKINESF